MELNKMDGMSMNIEKTEMEKLKSVFPQCFAEGKLDIEPLLTHTYPLAEIEEAYELFEHKREGVIKVAVEC